MRRPPVAGRPVWIAALVALALAALAVASGAVPFGLDQILSLDRGRDSTGARRAQARRSAVTRFVADPEQLRMSGLTPETAPVRTLDGTQWVGANDVARLLGAAKFWRSDLRRFEMRARNHRVLLVVDNPFALVDDETVLLDPAPRTIGGELFVSVAFIDLLPVDSTLARLVHAPSRGLVVQVPATGVVGSPSFSARGRETVIAFPADRPDEVVVASRSRAHFRVRFDGFFVGALPDSFTGGGLVRSARAIPTAGGCAFEFEVAREAAGFRVTPDRASSRLTLTLTPSLAPGDEPFAPEAPPGPKPLRVVVLDPGHGGDDPGVEAGGVSEKDLTLALALSLKAELERRVPVIVLVTRNATTAPSPAERAEFANRARADLVLSLHFDGLPSVVGRGATAYSPPATFVPSAEERRSNDLLAQPWRDVATRHATTSRALAESVLSLLELRNQGPARLREVQPYPLLGVNAPGLVLECATLTSEADRKRVTDEAGLRALAATIADGVVAYARGE